MLFWLVTIPSLAFAWMGVRLGLYMVWQTLFNVLVSIYVGVMLTPTLVGLVPEIGGSGYNYAACVAGLAVLLFLAMQTITTSLLTGLSDVEFPRFFETIGSPVLGFLLGSVTVSFLFFLIYIMPLSRSSLVAWLYPDDVRPVAVRTTERACKFIGAVSLQFHDETVERTIAWLSGGRLRGVAPEASPFDEFDPGRSDRPGWIEGIERERPVP